MWINSSFWSLMDLRHIQPHSERNEMLTVGSEGVFSALLVIFFMSCFSFHSTPTPIFSPSLHIHIQEDKLSSFSLHDIASFCYLYGKMEPRGQKFSFIPQHRDGENDKFMANHEVLSCKLRKVQSRAIWQYLLPPSESLSHFKNCLCFPSKIGNP